MGVILGFLGMILFPLFIRLLGVEIGVRHMPLCKWLVRIAAARLPLDERAAVESEWLAVIDDLRSPTAQLLHSLSYVVSAFRIREAIEPQANISPYARAVIVTQLFLNGVACGGFAAIAFGARERLFAILQLNISRPAGIALLFILGVLAGAASYAQYRLLQGYFVRRARRRANTPIE